MARTNKFETGMKRLDKAIKRFSRKIRAAARMVAKFGAALAAAAVGGMSLMVRSSFKAIDVTAKVADKLGIAIEKLVGLRFAAKKSGIEMRTFDMALQRMTRRISEAAVGTGEAQAALKELGIDAQKAAGMSRFEQFLLLADALEKVTLQGDRVRLGFKLFDSEGVALINMVDKGASGIRKMVEQARMLGLTFSRAAAQGVVRANDALTDLFATARGVANQLAIGLAPVVEGMTTRFRSMGLSGKDMALAIVEAMEQAGLAVAVLAKTLTVIPLAIARIRQIGASATEKAAGRVAKFFGFISALMPPGAARQAATKAGRAADSFAGGAGALVKDLTKEIADRNAELDKTFGDLVKEFAKMKDAIKGIDVPLRLPRRGGQINVAEVAEIAAKAVSGGGRDRFATSRVISNLRDVIPGGGGGAKKQNVIDEEAKRQRDEMLRIWREIVRSRNRLFVPAGP